MYVKELGENWFDHPFWRSSFKIEDAQTLKRIHDSGIADAWIDTERGLDVAGGISQEESEAEIERELSNEACETVVSGLVAMEQEVARAARIAENASWAVAELFQEVRMGRAIQVETVLPMVDDIAASVLRNPGVLIAITRLRKLDNYTYLHSVSVCALMVALGHRLGLDAEALREVGLAGLQHDIDLLNKRGQLTEVEFDELRRHAAKGYETLLNGRTGADEAVLDVCRHHHERVDGTGYPDRLARRSACMRRWRLSTTYTTPPHRDVPTRRPGCPPMPCARAEWSATHFDTRLFHSFVKTVEIYPIGMLVRLKSGHLGVVLDQTEGSLLTPRVKVFFSIGANRRKPTRTVELSSPLAGDEIVAHEDPEAWGFKDLHTLWSGLDKPLA